MKGAEIDLVRAMQGGEMGLWWVVYFRCDGRARRIGARAFASGLPVAVVTLTEKGREPARAT